MAYVITKCLPCSGTGVQIDPVNGFAHACTNCAGTGRVWEDDSDLDGDHSTDDHGETGHKEDDTVPPWGNKFP